MRVQYSNLALRTFSSVLAIILLLSTVPLFGGIALTTSSNQPSLTVNICQPTQAVNHASNAWLAHPAISTLRFRIFCLGPATVTLGGPIIDRNVIPDPPPPEAFD
jgi:hypothetical protein